MPTAPEPPAALSAADSYDALMRLKALLDAKVLSQEEFEAEKQKLLST